MEELNIANERLKAVWEDLEREYRAHVDRLNGKETELLERLGGADKKRLDAAEEYGDEDAGDGDVLEINAGGEVITAKRSTLTQLRGTRFEALFSGRWDKKLQKDSNGLIFLDVNPVAFRAIVDYLNELAISSKDDPPSSPSVDEENKHMFDQHLELFGLCATNMPESNIIKSTKEVKCLHNWLEEVGSNGQLRRLYCGSRDGLTSEAAFHSKCDDRGSTLTVIETTDGYVLGGFSNTPWSSSRGYKRADKAFLFVLSGSDVSSPSKMKLLDQEGSAVYHSPANGPSFGRGQGLRVRESKVSMESSGPCVPSYAPWPAGQLSQKGALFTIKEMEVFLVEGSAKAPILSSIVQYTTRELPQVEPATTVSKEINEALNTKEDSLLKLEAHIVNIENAWKDEQELINAFADGDAKDIVMLNVSGEMMATKRSTLLIAEDSVLASQFDDSKWTEQGHTPRVKEWTPDDVASWTNNIDGIPTCVGSTLKENGITGPELLALNMEGLEKLGIARTGTQCLLVKEVQALEKATEDVVTLIEHSPYCFGKIIDFLRLQRLHTLGLTGKPSLPKVCDEQKSRFERVARYYFPGDSAKFILGPRTRKKRTHRLSASEIDEVFKRSRS